MGNITAHVGRGGKDLVCGMSVSPEKAAAASFLEGNTHSFCSRSCRDKFEQATGTYITVAHNTR